MCTGCTVEEITLHGPVTVTGDHVAVGPLIRRLYDTEWGQGGGPLHCLLDDWNVEDSYVEPEEVARSVWQWLEWCRGSFTHDDYALVLDIAARLYALPTEADRALAISMAHDIPGLLPGMTITVQDDGLVFA